MEPIRGPETSAKDYQSTPCYIPEEYSFYLFIFSDYSLGYHISDSPKESSFWPAVKNYQK
jgi:hypothetical protein